MPLKLVPPREGKSSNYTIRGTYLGVSIDRTTGTADRAAARKVLNTLKIDIERGAIQPRKGLTFAAGAMAYIRAGGDDRFLSPLNDYFADTPIAEIEQSHIDEAAVLLYPDAAPATRNRQVYTPLSAIFKHNGIDRKLKRPKGAQGQTRIDWIWPEQAERLLEEAGKVDPEFRTLLVFLLYCGTRLSETLRIKVDDVRLSEAFAFVGRTKNGEPRPVHLPPFAVAELANHPRGLDRKASETLFKFRKSGSLYLTMARVSSMANLPIPFTFHTCRHTWATWMRRYGNLDTKGLVSTGAWADEKSASRYQHVIVSEEAQRADLLPTPNRGKSVENGKS